MCWIISLEANYHPQIAALTKTMIAVVYSWRKPDWVVWSAAKRVLIFGMHVAGTVSQSVSICMLLQWAYTEIWECALDCKAVVLIMACWIFLISAAQQALGDCVPVEPNPLLMGGQSTLNSEWNDGVGLCLRADSNTSIQSKWNVCIYVLQNGTKSCWVHVRCNF